LAFVWSVSVAWYSASDPPAPILMIDSSWAWAPSLVISTRPVPSKPGESVKS